MLNITTRIMILAGLTGSFLNCGVVKADTFVREIEEAFAAKPDQELRIDVGSGDVEVHSGSSDSVLIKVLMSVKASDEAKAEGVFENTLLEMTESSDKITVKTGISKKEARSWFGLKRPKLPKIKVIATCPPNFDLSLDTGSGNILVENVSGHISLDTGSGNIEAVSLGGSVYADTGSGNIDIQDLVGDLVADTGSGNISVEDLNGQLFGDTGSGNIFASGAITRFTGDTGSGSIEISTSLSLLEDSIADTGSGSIRIQLPPSATFRFSAQSRSGTIECAFPNVSYTIQEKRRLEGAVGQKGPRISLDAGSGNVRILPQS